MTPFHQAPHREATRSSRQDAESDSRRTPRWADMRIGAVSAREVLSSRWMESRHSAVHAPPRDDLPVRRRPGRRAASGFVRELCARAVAGGRDRCGSPRVIAADRPSTAGPGRGAGRRAGVRRGASRSRFRRTADRRSLTVRGIEPPTRPDPTRVCHQARVCHRDRRPGPVADSFPVPGTTTSRATASSVGGCA